MFYIPDFFVDPLSQMLWRQNDAIRNHVEQLLRRVILRLRVSSLRLFSQVSQIGNF